MPIYEYSCKKCGHDFEELVFGNQTPPCPKCGSADTAKLISCPCLHSGESFRAGQVGQTMAMPSGKGGCAGCSGGSCASCH